MTKDQARVMMMVLLSAVSIRSWESNAVSAEQVTPQTMLIKQERQVLGVFDGDVAFRISVHPEPDKAGKTIQAKTLRFRYNGTLQVIRSVDDEASSPAQDTAVGGFLVVDESKSPPEVVLTKNADEASRWEIDYSRRAPSGAVGAIRQSRADGKQAWLIASGNRTEVTMGGNRFLIAKAIISFTTKEVYTLQYHNGPSGR